MSTSGLYTAPDSLGTDSVTATSGSVTGTAVVTASDPLPTVTTAASASPAPVTGTTTALSVLGGDYKGESTLTYTWAITGTPPATVTFSANGTNAAKNTTATFTAAGTYSFQVTISDGQVSTTSSVTVTVNQTLTTIYVTPSSPTVDETLTQQFTAVAYDQFGEALSSSPTFTWSNTGLGSVSTSGLYTAPDSTGTASVTATSGSVSGSTTIAVDALPTVSTPATATSDIVTGTTTQLSVLGASSSYDESDLIYTWAAVSLPTGADPTYSVNGTNAAKSTTVTFNETGDYTFQVTIADPLGGSVTSTVEITVAFTATSLTVSPSSLALNAFQTEQFQATVVDQFGNTVISPSGLTWTVIGGGTINSTGLFTAPDADASATVEASCGSVNATTSVSISVPAPAVTELSTSSGSIYGGTSDTITGHYFTGASSVMFGSVPASSFTVNNDGSITALVPAELVIGTVDVTVTTPYGTSTTSSSDHFSAAEVPPEITSVSTTSGSTFGGDSVTITGSNFTDVNQLMFGAEFTQFFTVVNDSTIVVITPAHAAGTFDISLSNPTQASTTSAADKFTYMNTVATLENQNYTFTTADFEYSDPNDTAGSSFSAIKITTLPSAGTLTDNGNEVTSGQSVPVADINAGLLVFSPETYANGTAYSSFNYQVATGDGGTTLDTTLKTMTINVTPVTQAPTGTSHTVSTPMNTAYAFSTADFGFSDPHNSPGYNLLAVEITTLPTSGVLTDNGVDVTARQYVTDVDLSNSALVFTPAENATGTGDASFQFQVQSNGSTSNDGVNVDPSAKTITINVTNVTQPPVGTSNTVRAVENGSYTFAASDFGFTDPNNSPANNLAAVEITTLPAAGTLEDNGTTVTARQFVSLMDIEFGSLVFTPAANASGTSYASFTFQVQSNGSTAYGGVNVDTTARTMTINVVAVPQTPVGTSNTVATLDDMPYTFGVNDFGFTESSAANSSYVLQAVEITSLPTHGSLMDNSVAVTAHQFISAGDISGGCLVFTPGASASGAGYSQFTFQVQDNGGTAGGRVDTDPSAKTMTINADSTPVGTSNTVTTTEGTPYVFSTSDFGLTEPPEADNSLLAVKITAPPAAGTLADNGVTVTAGQFVSASDISSGKLIYTPPTGLTGTVNTVFAFQVQDNGGTADGRVDTDPMARAMMITVTPVNLAPTGTSNTVTTSINTPYTFATTDFGFSDSNPSPANSLLAVEITTLPTAGTLTDNGVAVTARQFVTASDIGGSELVFTPATNASGSAYASFTFQVEDNGSTAGGGVTVDPTARTMTLNVNSVVDAPVVSGSITYAQGGSHVTVPVNPSISVTDATNSTLASATVAITNFVATEDQLGFTANSLTMGNITGSFNSTTGVLTLTSAGAKATLTQWDAALQSVTYTDTSSTPNATPRQIAITVNNGQSTNNTSAPLTTTVLTGPSTPVFTSSSFSLALNADAQPGDSVGVLLATDPNPSDTLTFSLSGTGTDQFAINATTGEVTYIGGTLTAGDSYSLTATVTNQSGVSSTATVEASVLSVGSSGATGSQPLAVPTGLSATYSYIPSSVIDGTTTTSSSGSYWAGVVLGNANAIATGTQSLTVTTTTVGDPTTTQVTTWSYDITTSDGLGDTVHEWGGYTETQTATTDATTGLTTATSTTYTSVDNYDDTEIESDATGTSTAHEWGSTSVSYSASNSTATSSTPGSASDSYSESDSGGYTSIGSYTDPIDGGSVSGSESSSGTYSDSVSESDAFSGDTSGNWWQTSGSGSDSGSSTDSGSSSGSGTYTTPLSGGSMTGSEQESDSESDSESYSVTETYVAGSGWTSSGTASASGSSSGSDSYSGSGSYSTSSSSDSTSGTSSESGGETDQSTYQDSYIWGSGNWVQTSGSTSDSSSGSDSASYTESGTYTSDLSEDDPSLIGLVEGTSSGSGSESHQYSDSESSTYDATTAQWVSSGSGSESGSGSSESSSSGSGSYLEVTSDGADSGSYSETGGETGSESETLTSTSDASGNTTTTGTGSGSDSYSSSDSFSGSGSYSDSLPGGTMSGTETDSDTGGETGGDSYTTTWDDANGDWVLTSGSGSDSETTGFSSSYSGSGTFTASGTMTDDYGDPNGAWSETSSGSESGSYSSSETDTSNYQVVNGAWQDTGDTGTDSEQGTDTTSSSTSGTYTEGTLSGSYSASGTSTESFSASDSDGPSGITGTASESSSGSSTESDSYSGTETYGGTTGSDSGSDSDSSSDSVTENYTYDPTSDSWVLDDGSTKSESSSTSSTESFSGTSGSSGTGSDYSSYSFSDSQSASGSDNSTVSGGNWVESSATDSGSSSASDTYTSTDSGSYVSQYGLIGTTSDSESSSSTESLTWSDSMSDGTWTYTGGGSASGSGSDSYSDSASGSYNDGAQSGSYSESFSGGDSEGDSITFSRASNGSWLENGSSSGSGSESSSGSDSWTSVVTTAGSGGSETDSTSGSAADQYSETYSTSNTLTNNAWGVASGSGSGSGTESETSSTSTSGTYSYTFDSGAGTVNGTLSGSGQSAFSASYTDMFTMVEGNWVTSQSGSGTESSSGSASSSGSGSYSAAGGSSGSYASGGIDYSYSGDGTSAVSITEGDSNTTQSSASFWWTDDSWGETTSSSGSGSSTYLYSSSGSSSGSDSAISESGGTSYSDNSSSSDTLTTTETDRFSYSNTSTISPDSSGNETTTSSGTSNDSSSSGTTLNWTLSYTSSSWTPPTSYEDSGGGTVTIPGAFSTWTSSMVAMSTTQATTTSSGTDSASSDGSSSDTATWTVASSWSVSGTMSYSSNWSDGYSSVTGPYSGTSAPPSGSISVTYTESSSTPASSGSGSSSGEGTGSGGQVFAQVSSEVLMAEGKSMKAPPKAKLPTADQTIIPIEANGKLPSSQNITKLRDEYKGISWQSTANGNGKEISVWLTGGGLLIYVDNNTGKVIQEVYPNEFIGPLPSGAMRRADIPTSKNRENAEGIVEFKVEPPNAAGIEQGGRFKIELKLNDGATMSVEIQGGTSFKGEVEVERMLLLELIAR